MKLQRCFLIVFLAKIKIRIALMMELIVLLITVLSLETDGVGIMYLLRQRYLRQRQMIIKDDAINDGRY